MMICHIVSRRREPEEPHPEVCTGCGNYYSLNKFHITKWRETFKPRVGEVMPQQCYSCMFTDTAK